MFYYSHHVPLAGAFIIWRHAVQPNAMHNNNAYGYQVQPQPYLMMVKGSACCFSVAFSQKVECLHRRRRESDGFLETQASRRRGGRQPMKRIVSNQMYGETFFTTTRPVALLNNVGAQAWRDPRGEKETTQPQQWSRCTSIRILKYAQFVRPNCGAWLHALSQQYPKF